MITVKDLEWAQINPRKAPYGARCYYKNRDLVLWIVAEVSEETHPRGYFFTLKRSKDNPTETPPIVESGFYPLGTDMLEVLEDKVLELANREVN